MCFFMLLHVNTKLFIKVILVFFLSEGFYFFSPHCSKSAAVILSLSCGGIEQQASCVRRSQGASGERSASPPLIALEAPCEKPAACSGWGIKTGVDAIKPKLLNELDL